jgi:hypothetical protein
MRLTTFGRLLVLSITLLAATAAFALLYGRTDTYYSDATFTSAVGEVYTPGVYCQDDEPYQWGTTSDYKIVRRWSACGPSGSASEVCWQNINGTWTQIPCS